MKSDVILTLPCPLCQPSQLITSTWEQENAPGDLPFLVSVTGCPHAQDAMRECDGESIRAPVAFWRAVFHEIENWARDQYTDALEARMDHQRSLRGEP